MFRSNIALHIIIGFVVSHSFKDVVLLLICNAIL